MRYLKSFIYKLLFLFILFTALLMFLLTTTPGLFITTKLVKIVVPGELNIEQPQGRLIDRFTLGKLRFENKNIELILTNIDFKWRWKALFNRQLLVKNLHINELKIVKKNKDKPHINLEKLPLEIIIKKGKLDKLLIENSQLDKLELEARLNKKFWKISRLNLNYLKINFELQAEGQSVFPYSASAILRYKLGNLISGGVKINGDFSLYNWQIYLTNPALIMSNGTLKNGSELHSVTQIKKLLIPGHQTTVESSINIDGILPDLRLNLKAVTEAPKAILELQANTTELGLISKGFLKTPATELAVDLAYDNLAKKIESKFSLGSNMLTVSGFPPYNWQLKADIPKPESLDPRLKGLQTKLSFEATTTSANNGVASLIIQPGNYQFLKDNSLKYLRFTGGQFKALLDPQKLQVGGQLTIDSNKSLLLDLSLPQLVLDQNSWESQRILGNLSLKVNSLEFLQSFSPLISKIEGQLTALIKVNGTIGKPVLESNLSLDKASLLLPKLGINLSPIQVNLESSKQQWNLQGSLSSQGQKLNLNGKGNFSPNLTGIINLNATDFPLIKTDEYLINLSPDLVLSILPNSINISGKILVPNAQIKPRILNTVSLSTDVVIVKKEGKSKSIPWPITTDINLEMGNNVALDLKGLKGFLDGSVHLQQLPRSPLGASGQLTIRDGSYKAYGQDLTVDQGELLFTGSSVDNPGINIRASRRVSGNQGSVANSDQLFDFNSANLQTLDIDENTTVGILIKGHLKSPKIELFSEPSNLSKADILSILILGKPASQANAAGGQLLLKAISSMNLGSGASGLQLLEQLKQTLGVDVDIKSSNKINQETNAINKTNSVVVGKSLSKRFYLSYNYGLAQDDSNVVTLTYLLTKFLSIQINTSLSANAIDLLYTRKRNKQND